MLRASFALIVALSIGSICNAENWPSWRGPTGDGIAAAGDYPTEFSSQDNVAWKVELPGRGSSTPAVWGDQIFVTCPIDDKDGVVCYDFDGNELWKQTFGEERTGKHRNGSGCNPSPVTDGENVVVYYKSGTLACLDLKGNVRWEINLQEKYGEDTLWWDLGTSPVLAGGNAVIAVMQDGVTKEGDSFLIAINLATGEVSWKQQREFECEKESDQSYTTPRVLQVDGKEVIVTWGADHLTGHLATSGDLLWQCGGFNPENKGMWRVIASAAVEDDLAIVPYGRGEYLAAVDLRNPSGDVTATHRLWEKTGIGTDVPTPIIHEKNVILLSDGKRTKGKLSYLDKATGDVLWEYDLPKAKASYYASPVIAGGILYCAREDGIIMACSITDGLELMSENDMDEAVIATPIPIRNKLLVRGEQHLFLIGK